MFWDRDTSSARNALPRYFAILEGMEKPNFHALRRVSVDFDEHMSIEELWRLHAESMQALREGKLEEESPGNLLELKAVIARKILKRCVLCEYRCGIDREKSIGYCRVKESRVATAFLHMGEEPELVPSYTVFFSGCNFRCVFCQNWDISQFRVGRHIDPKHLAEKIEEAYFAGAKNVNFVGGEPTPNLPYILDTLIHLYVPIPIVWNSNMYMSEEAMSLLDGVVDIYLADFKWGSDQNARRYSRALNYWSTITRNFLLAKQHYRAEFLIRHLVIPQHLEDTERILHWIAENIGREVRINVMFQYRPEYHAYRYPELSRALNYKEMQMAKEIVRKYGFRNALIG